MNTASSLGSPIPKATASNSGSRQQNSRLQNTRSGTLRAHRFFTPETLAGTLLRPPPKYKTPVSAPKAEGIRHGIVHGNFSRGVGHKIQIAAFAGTLQVHGRRHNLVAQR